LGEVDDKTVLTSWALVAWRRLPPGQTSAGTGGTRRDATSAVIPKAQVALVSGNQRSLNNRIE
jgi:hypothetical protein